MYGLLLAQQGLTDSTAYCEQVLASGASCRRHCRRYPFRTRQEGMSSTAGVAARPAAPRVGQQPIALTPSALHRP